ncbi:MAG: hypothetical protein NVS9B15_01000 [Acidobacteriaceae bacterium]
MEKDGFFYGGGTQDMKCSDAASVVSFLRLKHEGFVPDRDIILALTAGEEGGEGNGVDWLLKNRLQLVEAGFALNGDSGGLTTVKGKPLNINVEATEKLHAEFELIATSPGGYNSVPVPDNARYHVADALAKVERYTFPFALNAVTRAYSQAMASVAWASTETTTGRTARDGRIGVESFYTGVRFDYIYLKALIGGR